MQTIADRVGVSKNAVSLALKNDRSISKGTKEKILKVASELGYQRNHVLGEVMSQMRKRGSDTMLATIALINGNNDPKAFRSHPTIPYYVSGCSERARMLGYGVDPLWLHDESITARRWIEILETRGIRGVVIIGLMKENRIPEHFIPVVERFPVVVTGVRTRAPSLPFSCVDHYILALRAFEKAIALGYRRPALVLDSVIDDLVEHRFSAGYYTGQKELPVKRQLRPFYQVAAARKDPGLFEKWLEKEAPDVIFTLYNEVRDWVESAGLQVPADIGLIQLEWRSSHANWAGMNQHNDIVGQKAFDMLLGMIHRGEVGIPEFPSASLVGPTWIHGKTVRDLNA